MVAGSASGRACSGSDGAAGLLRSGPGPDSGRRMQTVRPGLCPPGWPVARPGGVVCFPPERRTKKENDRLAQVVLQKWCQRAGLNCRPRAYESPALPLSYSGENGAVDLSGCGALANKNFQRVRRSPAKPGVQTVRGWLAEPTPHRRPAERPSLPQSWCRVAQGAKVPAISPAPVRRRQGPTGSTAEARAVSPDRSRPEGRWRGW